MSESAIWVALSVDWMDSPMLDGLTSGSRLAWVCLLCEAKAKGRGGIVRIRAERFARAYGLETSEVVAMIEAAKRGGAIEERDGSLTIVNWRKYQQKASKAAHYESRSQNRQIGKKAPTVQDSTGQDSTPHASHAPQAGGRSKRFVPPTVDEVREYCAERGNGVDPEAFLAHYEARGWMAGKSRVKDWRACVRTWERQSEKTDWRAKRAQRDVGEGQIALPIQTIGGD